MVQQQPDPREPRPLDELADHAPAGARQRAMRKLADNERRTRARLDDVLVRPGFREVVERQMRSRWREPVIVLRLDENAGPGFDVPGRRADGTVAGKRLVRRFFWNVARGVGGVVIVVFSLLNAGGAGDPFRREIRVRGPADAMALDLLDRLRRARGPWLVCGPEHLAVVDTGSTYLDPADGPPVEVLWEPTQPRRPQVCFRSHILTWPDGSTFRFALHGRAEAEHIRKYVEFPNTIHWHGRPTLQDRGGQLDR